MTTDDRNFRNEFYDSLDTYNGEMLSLIQTSNNKLWSQFAEEAMTRISKGKELTWSEESLVFRLYRHVFAQSYLQAARYLR